jgi:DNA primase
MKDWLDFKELRRELDFGDVLRHYGVEPKLTGDQHHGFCPLPDHGGRKNSPSFSANLKKGIWQCFGCGEGGNVLDFAVVMERANPKNGADVRKVAAMLAATLLSEGKASKEESLPSEEKKVLINAPLGFNLKALDASHSYLSGRGLAKETIDGFELGYCSRGILAKRIAIPIHDSTGNLVGYAGRVVDDSLIVEENPKYRFPGSRKRDGVLHEFRKSLLLYNAHRVVRPVADLIVVEGFMSVWWITQAGVAQVVATMGASCSDEQARLIIARVKDDGHVWALCRRNHASCFPA